VIDYKARIIFSNASALNTNLILLHSRSNRFPNGLGNDNGLLGKYVAFQNYRASLTAEMEGFLDHYYFGRNPTDLILANYKNLHRQETDYFGGYTTFLSARRSHGDADSDQGIGADFKESMCEPGGWKIFMYLQGETVPKITNHVRLSPDQKDQWGIPLLITSVEYDDNDQRMIDDFHKESKAMLEAAGCTNIETYQNRQAPGLDIHEMGGCRMGKDPRTSLLNEWNQLHLCKNVFVTDGACMTSTGNQSPSILYMALTARAANHAASQFKKGDL
jgi:choline dehydrogenase-like flavoprotein